MHFKSYKKLHVVSNRLPITINLSSDGNYSCQKSCGGLVSALSGLSETSNFLWYGWPGLDIPEKDVGRVANSLNENYEAVPCLMSGDLANRHYNGFSNSVLWPLFHYQPGLIKYKDEDWDAYREVNRIFAKKIAERVSDGDLVWVHDYHLMMLPAMLREETRQLTKTILIGFFLHTPFPCDDMFKILPVRNELLEGVLQGDLIGFQTNLYAGNFIKTCSTMLNAAILPGGIFFNNKFSAIGTHPIGIGPESFFSGVKTPEVEKRSRELKQAYGDRKIMLGVDRLDYIKGIPLKLLALERFLHQRPEWIGHLVLVQVVIPSREDLQENHILLLELEHLSNRLNTEFADDQGRGPIELLYTSLNHTDLLAHYRLANALLVSSIRDGMNLVSYEYVASQASLHGVLVLSEFAGAAESLEGALLFNPWSTFDFTEKIYRALVMDAVERQARWESAYACVRKNTSAKWGRTFLEALSATVKAGTKETGVMKWKGKGGFPKRKGSESDKGFDSGVEVE